MPKDDKSEKARSVKGEGKPFKQWEYPLPGCFVSVQEAADLVLYGIVSDRLKKLGW